jgi:hypothetical protein
MMFLVFGYRDKKKTMEFFGTTNDVLAPEMVKEIVTLPNHLLGGGTFNAFKYPDVDDMWWIDVGSRPLEPAEIPKKGKK